ncbi:DUF937 domain-containing protein [Mesorhizobium sp. CAU 1741]|uniref:DUF937 domain-containing protein n=1 Tax=Mesorhizobium sp. CAU 1741 TaxID=3140366 RepID=UPI00325A8A57
MLPLYDMLANAQNGHAFQQMAKQYGLSQAQVQEAVAALLPAFSQGLKRNASSPGDLGAFLSALSSGQHARYFEDASNAFSQQGLQEGNGILGHLFGSKDLSRAVASQAAQATGIGQDLLKQMLPALASMIMGGLFKQSTGQVGASGTRASANPLQEIIEQMMRQGGGMMPPQPQAQPSPLDNPFGKILEGMFGGGGQAQPQPQAPQTPFGDNPLGRIFEEMMGGGQVRPEAPAAPEPKANPSGRARTPYDDLFGDMFEAGAKTRDGYQKNMESVFDQFLQGMKQRR